MADEGNDQGSPIETSGEDQVVTQQPGVTQQAKEPQQSVVTQQPKKNDDDGKEGPSAELNIDATNLLSEDGCVSFAAGCGSISKEYMDGAIDAEYVGPNMACVMSCAELPNVVTDCTFELCSANYLCGIILCKIGLALDTKFTWTPEGLQAEALSIGLDTSEGIAVGALGFKIGLADKEKREKKWAKMKLKWKKNEVAPESSEGDNDKENVEEDNPGEE